MWRLEQINRRWYVLLGSSVRWFDGLFLGRVIRSSEQQHRFEQVANFESVMLMLWSFENVLAPKKDIRHLIYEQLGVY